MKRVILLMSSILFSTFFYQQNIGLNLSLFTLLTITALTATNWQKFSNKSTILKTIAYLITGIFVFLYHSNLSIIANMVAFITLVGSFSAHKSSIYIKWVNGIYTIIVASFALYYDSLQIEVEQVKKVKINYPYWLKIIGIPLIIILVFINLYRSGNPVFDELITEIDFNFINYQWVLFAGLGYYLFYNITQPITIEPITTVDIDTKNDLEKNALNTFSSEKLKSEKQLGILLLFLLNALILIFLITDVLHLSKIHKMVASQLSEQVHNGVNALLFSNVLAIIIILYFFRGNLNFYKKIKDVKRLAFIWIFLNLSVVIITAIKNIEYIVSFGFTHKRIGVLFFLTITSIGLITTLIKVAKIKNLWFLFRKNTQIAFAILMLATTIIWDKVITYYNINYAEQLDVKYLIELSNNNTFLLKEYAEKNEIEITDELKINDKHHDYLEDLRLNSWQEMVYDNFKIRK